MRSINLFLSIAAISILPLTPIACGTASEGEHEDEPAKPASCRRHAECASAVCDLSGDPDGTRGVCLDESSVIYVDNRTIPTCDARNGTKPLPFCTVDEALARLTLDRHAIRVAAGTERYGQLRLRDTTVALYGPDDGGQPVFSSEEDVTTIWAYGASDVTLDSITVQSLGGGIRCESAPGQGRLTLRRSAVHYADGRSLVVSGCELTMDRVHLAGATFGVEIRDGARYRITNSIISSQSGFVGLNLPALSFSDDSSGIFAFNTVAGNHSYVECGATPRRLESSIFINPSVFDDPYWIPDPADPRPTSQLSGNCVLVQSVVGARDSTTSPGAIHLDPDFVDPDAGNYHLARTPANRACCIDKAPERPDIQTDFDGDARPMGAASDIGADEVE